MRLVIEIGGARPDSLGPWSTGCGTRSRPVSSVQVPLDFLEGLLADGRPLLLGAGVSIADCTLQASLQFLRWAKADLFGERPLLRAWDERYRARPAAQNVLRW